MEDVEPAGNVVETRIVDGGQRRRAIERRAIDPRGKIVQARFDFAPGQRDLRRIGGAGLAGDFLEPLAQFADLTLEMFDRRHFLHGLRDHRANLFRLVVDLLQTGGIGPAGLAQLLDLVLDFLQLARDAVEIGGRACFRQRPAHVVGKGFDRREHGLAHAVVARAFDPRGKRPHGVLQRRHLAARRELAERPAHRRDLLAERFQLRGGGRLGARLRRAQHRLAGGVHPTGEVAHRGLDTRNDGAWRDVAKAAAQGGNVAAQVGEAGNSGVRRRGQRRLDARGQITGQRAARRRQGCGSAGNVAAQVGQAGKAGVRGRRQSRFDARGQIARQRLQRLRENRQPAAAKSLRMSSMRPDRAWMPFCSRSIRAFSVLSGAGAAVLAAAMSNLRASASNRSSSKAVSCGDGGRDGRPAAESRSRWR